MTRCIPYHTRPQQNANCLGNLGMAWWRALLALCAGNSPPTGEFSSRRRVTRSLMFSLICAWTNNWVSNRDAGKLRRHRTDYYVTVIGCSMCYIVSSALICGYRVVFLFMYSWITHQGLSTLAAILNATFNTYPSKSKFLLKQLINKLSHDLPRLTLFWPPKKGSPMRDFVIRGKRV